MKEEIDKIVQHTWTLRVARFGLVTRGVIYLFAGLLALELAAGLRQSGGNLTEVLTLFSKQTFGQVFLVILILGFLGYSLWGLVRVITFPNGVLTKLGYLISAVSYAILAYVAWSLLRGVGHIQESGDPTKLSQQVLQIPYGREMLIFIGLCWMGGAIIQIISAFRAKFKENLKMGKVNDQAKHWPVLVGKIGLVSRSIIFLLIGIFIVKAAWHYNPEEAFSTGEVLKYLMEVPLGAVIVVVLSLGLMCFGVFSILQAWFVRVPQE